MKEWIRIEVRAGEKEIEGEKKRKKKEKNTICIWERYKVIDWDWNEKKK